MNNNEFDNIIKSNLENVSVTPTPSVGKTLGRKMVLKNIWFFHKKKAALVLLLICSSSLFLWNNSSNDLAFSEQLANTNNNINSNTELEENATKTNVNIENNISSNTKEIENSIKTTSISSKKKNDTRNNYAKINSTTTTKSNLKNTFSNKNTPTQQLKNSFDQKVNRTKEQLANFTPEDIQNKRFSNKNAQFLTFDNKNSIVDYTYDETINSDYAQTNKSSISFDAFLTPYNQTKISNTLDEQYQNNWWDFYRKTGLVSSGLEGGIRVNYDWKNIVTSTGITYNKVRNYSPKYIYESNNNQYLLNVLGLNEISGVQVNGVDSAHYVFYTAKDQELINSIENDAYSTFHYINIPLKTGYEFKAEKFSILLQAGVAFNKLIGANGNYLRRYQTSETLDIYYNKGIETALLTRKNSMLKKSYFSLLASLAGNVKVSPSLDLFGEFNFSQSHNSVTEKEYFLQKDVMNFGTNFGVKYYLEPRIKKSNLDQELF